MPIDIETDELLSISQAAKLIPGRPCLETIWRWRTKGVRGHRLECVCVGGRRFFTTRAAIEEFIALTTAAANTQQPPPVKAKPSKCRQRQLDQADEILARAGI